MHYPFSKQDRVQLLDLLRGFALFGILLDNIFGFTGWGFMTASQREGNVSVVQFQGVGVFLIHTNTEY